jgi:hypothetical protein
VIDRDAHDGRTRVVPIRRVIEIVHSFVHLSIGAPENRIDTLDNATELVKRGQAVLSGHN